MITWTEIPENRDTMTPHQWQARVGDLSVAVLHRVDDEWVAYVLDMEHVAYQVDGMGVAADRAVELDEAKQIVEHALNRHGWRAH